MIAVAPAHDVRPSCALVRSVARDRYARIANDADGRVAIAHCRPVGRTGRRVIVRITGDAPQRLRVAMWAAGGGDYWYAARNAKDTER